MAMKDWKAIYENKNMIRYKHKGNGNILEIYPEKIRGKTPWFVAVEDETTIRDKEFSSKPLAVSFAKQYMRTH